MIGRADRAVRHRVAWNWLYVYLVVVPIASATAMAQPEHPVSAGTEWLVYEAAPGTEDPKHIVLIAADQEYRSEEAMPMLAEVLSTRHGFHCTVLFSLNEDGMVDPTQKIRWEDDTVVHDIPGLEHLDSADLVILFSRLITLPEDQLAHIYRYLDSGKPIIGIRTANHGFIGFDYEVEGKRIRFGEDVLGGSFRSHHGRWHQDSTRGIIVQDHQDHPVLRGVEDIWGPSDVYRTYPEDGRLPPECTPLVLGQPLMTREPDSPVNQDLSPLPVAWVKEWTGNSGRPTRVFHSTMGSARDLESAGLRRLLVNAVYWCLGLEDQIDPTKSVDVVGTYTPSASGFDYEKLGVKPRPPASFR